MKLPWKIAFILATTGAGYAPQHIDAPTVKHSSKVEMIKGSQCKVRMFEDGSSARIKVTPSGWVKC